MKANSILRLLAVSTLASTMASGSSQRRDEGVAILLSPSDMEWKKDPSIPDTDRARVMGSTVRPGARDVFMLRMGAGKEIPAHYHSGGFCNGVVVRGTVVVTTSCSEEKVLPPGSFFFVGGETVHSFRCIAGDGRCELFLAQPNAAERIGVECAVRTGGPAEGRSLHE